jgi:hypothetical protein
LALSEQNWRLSKSQRQLVFENGQMVMGDLLSKTPQWALTIFFD